MADRSTERTAHQGPTTGSVDTRQPRALAEASERGQLSIVERVVERIAVYVAADVPGSAAIGSSLDRATGRAYPKADVTMAGRRATVSLSVAAVWPTPLADVTAGVRDTVTRALQDVAGLHVDSVDVHAAKVIQPAQLRQRRRRVQ